MMIIMKANATPQQVEAVIAQVKAEGLSVHLSQGVARHLRRLGPLVLEPGIAAAEQVA